jgi:hypothetical protein
MSTKKEKDHKKRRRKFSINSGEGGNFTATGMLAVFSVEKSVWGDNWEDYWPNLSATESDGQHEKG